MFALKVYLVTLKVIHFDLSYLPRHTRLRDETEKMKEGYTSRALDHQGHTPDIHFQVISPNLNHWHHCRHTSQLLVTAGFIWKELYSENSQIAQKWPCEPIRTQYIFRLPRLRVEQSRFTPRPETLCCDGPLGTCADLTFISLAFGFIPSKTQMTDHKDTPQLIPVECLNFPRTETINAKRDA